MSKVVTIFYAWQSDSPKGSNRNGIKAALAEAIAEVEVAHPDTTLAVDEATRNEAGSVNIPEKIRQKIEACDIFLGDVTTINPTASSRKTPNPNVVFEVGYAAAILGWERMILVANTAIGKLGDLPFDFDRQRIAQYDWQEDKSAKKAAASQLRAILVDAISAILAKDPRKRAEMFGESPDQIRRARDLENISWALSSFPVSTAQNFAEETPDHLHHKDLHFQEALEAVVSSQHFHLYDKVLDVAVRDLSKHWARACSFSRRYFAHDRNPLIYVFDQPGHRHADADVMKDYERIQKAKTKMAKALSKVLQIIRDGYVEIDVNKLSSQAHQNWVKFAKDAGFDELGTK